MKLPAPSKVGVLAARLRAPGATAQHAAARTAAPAPTAPAPTAPAPAARAAGAGDVQSGDVKFAEALGDALASAGQPRPEGARADEGELGRSGQPPRSQRGPPPDPRRAGASRDGAEATGVAVAAAVLLASADGAIPAAPHARRAETGMVPLRREPPRADPAPSADPGPASARVVPLPLVSAPEPRSAASPSPTTSAVQDPPVPPPPPDVDVGGALLRSAAHLRVDAGPMGAVDVHLRVRDGALHLRVDGDAAHLVEARSAELTRALAREGLQLASLEIRGPESTSLQGHGGGPRDERRRGREQADGAREDGARPGRNPARTAKAAVARGDSIDVQA